MEHDFEVSVLIMLGEFTPSVVYLFL